MTNSALHPSTTESRSRAWHPSGASHGAQPLPHRARPLRRRTPPTPAPPLRRPPALGLAAAGSVAVFCVAGATLLAAADTLAYAVLDQAEDFARSSGQSIAVRQVTMTRTAYRAGSESVRRVLTAA